MRRWREQDLAPFAALNADPLVMEHFPATLSHQESGALVGHIERGFREHGYGLWALELPGEASFIGFTGLAQVRGDVPFAPAVEVGWRLARQFWGRGLASEAARASLAFGFDVHGMPEIVAYTAMNNERSRAVMRRLGMTRSAAEDFAHPAIPSDDPPSLHVLYRLTAARWRANMLEACAGDTPTRPAPKN